MDNQEEQLPTPNTFNIYVTLVKNGKVTTEAYTKTEAENQGITDPKAYAFLDACDPTPSLSTGTVCKHDGFTQRDFERTGRLGCPHCYDTFKGLVMPLLERMHKGTKHMGKVPASSNNEQTLHNRLLRLHKQLDSAVQAERFEDAALVRDKIQTVQSQLEDSPPQL